MMILKIGAVLVITIATSVAAIFLGFIDRSGKSYHNSARWWSKMTLKIFGIKVTTKGLEHLDPSKHYVYVSNHASLFDIPAVFTAIPDDVRIVLKKELTRVPIWGWSLNVGHYIVIDRANAKDAMDRIDEAAKKIRNGASVLVFPEGTRSKDGKLQPFKRGAFALAARSGVPVVPVTIKNSYAILPKGTFTIRATDIEIVIDKPIESQGEASRESEMQLMEQVHSILEKNFV
ncbi:MAG: 1-acyl-sn-glycerol-3-phosphate acyltransferase [Ignavibacteriae bacterium]|nr:1-acyl-sn-glycerol-3-phosphate acyltransferase [Ignavibacteriota bacterium]